MKEEGWYRDPYGVHEDRWISDGTPTSLVRDRDIEAKDPPPEDIEPGALVPAARHYQSSGANDLRRADDAEVDSPNRIDVAINAFDKYHPSF